jgi:hypothetical protein
MNVTLNHSLEILLFVIILNLLTNVKTLKTALSEDDDPFEVKRIISVIKTMGSRIFLTKFIFSSILLFFIQICFSYKV